MKKIKIISALIILMMTSCSLEDFNDSPHIVILYSPMKLNDSTTILIKKEDANSIKIDSMRVGDTLSVKIHLFDFNFSLKSLVFNTSTDSSTSVVFSPNAGIAKKFSLRNEANTNYLLYKTKLKTDDLEFMYIAKKPSKKGSVTITLKTLNPDTLKCFDTLRIITPVKFLP